MNPEEILQRKMLKLFPDPKARAAAATMLNQYGTASHEHEPARVQLAILRLSGGDLRKIGTNVATAKKDYRDILAYAEYPRQAARDAWKLTLDQNKALEAEDRKDYEAWLKA